MGPSLGHRHGTDVPLEPLEGTSPADTWILVFWPQDLGDDEFLLS